jgi:hypothetical protein
VCVDKRKAVKIKGLLAQRLEQGTHNPLVQGSNPWEPMAFEESFVGAFAAVGRERYETSYEVSDGNNSNRLKDT